MKSATPAKFEIVTDSSLLSSVSKSSVSAIAEINALHADATTLADQARAMGETATRKAILLGLKLTALKDATPHGQWENLFASGQRRVKNSNAARVPHLLNFDETTARRYISVAANLMSQRLSSEQSAALMQLAARPESADLSAGECTFLDEVVPEKSLRQLYLSMGIVKPTRMEQRHLDDDSAARAPEKPKRQLSQAEKQIHLRDCARRDWFGTERPGLIEDGSILSILRSNIDHPEDSSLHHLAQHDLEILITDFKRFLKFATQFANK